MTKRWKYSDVHYNEINLWKPRTFWCHGEWKLYNDIQQSALYLTTYILGKDMDVDVGAKM